MSRSVYIVFLSLVLFSCKRANVTEVKPFGDNYPDTASVLFLKDKYPYMKLVTDNVVHLQVHDRNARGTSVEFNDEPLKLKVRYLPLETTDECLVGGSIAKLESDEASIFVFDFNNRCVLRFSQKDGSFVNKFGQKGKGPGEYTYIIDMSLNRTKKEVCLIDVAGLKYLYYDYDGRFLRDEPLYYFYNRVEFVGDYMIQDTNGNENTMVPSLNNNRLVLARLSDSEPEFVGFPLSEHVTSDFSEVAWNSFITCNEDVYYTYILSDTIWQVKPKGICEAKYVLKFPGRDNLFNNDDFMNMTDELYKERTNSVSCYYRDDICITEDFVHAGIVNGKDMLYCIQTGNYRYGTLFCSCFGTRHILDKMYTLNGKSFVSVLQPFDVLKSVNEQIDAYDRYNPGFFSREKLTEDERQLLSKMTAEDNPILMIVDIEPF